MSCTVNPLAGREAERPPRPVASPPQRWVVVGGGPAGMRAAVELAADGHLVTLLEATDGLGGQLRLARQVPGRTTVGWLIDDLERDLAAAEVDVRLGTPATPDLVASLRPDGVVLATGARAPRTTSLALGGAYAGGMPDRGTVDAFTAIAAPERLGRRIAVVDDDGTAYAAGIVLLLLGSVEQLELITPFETMLPHVGAGYDRPLLLERLGAHPGFRRHTMARVMGLAPGTVHLRDALTGVESTLADVDQVVAIEPRESVVVDGLRAPRVVVIGDAYAPRTIDAAIFEAVELAYDVAGLATLRG